MTTFNTQLNQLLIDDYQKDQAPGGADDLDSKYAKHIQSEYPRFQQCFNNGERAYITHPVQGRKTLGMEILTLYAYKNGYDAVVLTGPVMNALAIQTHRRIKTSKFLKNISDIGVTYVDLHKNLDHVTFNRKFEVFVTTIHPDRVTALKSYFDYRMTSSLTSIEEGYSPIRKVLIISDESEMFSVESVTRSNKPLECEKALKELIDFLNNKGCITNVIEVSATLWSKMVVQHINQEPVYGRQIFNLPLSNYYVGLGHGLELDGRLVDESKTVFNDATGYKDHLTYKQTANIENIVDKFVKDASDPVYGYSAHGLPEICVTILGAKKDGMTNAAEMIYECLTTKHGKLVGLWTQSSSPQMPRGCNWIVMTVNGDNTDGSISDRLKQIVAYRINRKEPNPEGVIIVSNKMASRGITIEIADGWNNPNSEHFGWYVNNGAMLGNNLKNIEQENQFLRPSGVRPPIKKHRMMVTADIKNQLESFYQFTTNLYGQMKLHANDDISDFSVTFFGNTKKKVAKGKHEKEIRKYLKDEFKELIPNKNRKLKDKTHMNRNIVLAVPQKLEDFANKNKYNSLVTRTQVDNYVRKHAKNFVPSASSADEVRCVKNKAWNKHSTMSTQVLYGNDGSKNANLFNGCKPHTTYTFFKENGKLYLFCHNITGFKGSKKNYMEYNVTVGNGTLVFPDTTVVNNHSVRGIK